MTTDVSTTDETDLLNTPDPALLDRGATIARWSDGTPAGVSLSLSAADLVALGIDAEALSVRFGVVDGRLCVMAD